MRYDDVINSALFKKELASLNSALAGSLVAQGAPPVLNGNLFYTHLQPDFQHSELHCDIDKKRRSFSELAQRGETLFEIGVNGGHSLLLAKHSNQSLKCWGVDVCEQLDPNWARVDIYVPTAMSWLQENYPGDFQFFVGNSLSAVPEFVIKHPDLRIDLFHVDGDKLTYLRDIVNMMPLLHEESLIIVDDINLGVVRSQIRQLLRAGIIDVHGGVKTDSSQRYRHAVFKPAASRWSALSGSIRSLSFYR